MQVNEYGLVAGKAIKSFDVYRGGQECGFEPHVAQRLVAAGVWKPNGASNVAEGEAQKQADLVDNSQDDVYFVGVESGTVKVPKNWREIHHAKRVSLAKSISGENGIDAKRADEIIAEAVKSQEEPE